MPRTLYQPRRLTQLPPPVRALSQPPPVRLTQALPPLIHQPPRFNQPPPRGPCPQPARRLTHGARPPEPLNSFPRTIPPMTAIDHFFTPCRKSRRRINTRSSSDSPFCIAVSSSCFV